MIRSLLTALVMLVYSIAVAQSKTSVGKYDGVRAVMIGEAVPDIALVNIFNYSVSKARLSDFRGKVVILDFWSTYCSPCIAAFPKFDSLQRKFADKLVVLPVVDQSKASEIIPKFWKTNSITKHLSIPTVIDDDKIFLKYFPRDGVPFEVWIDAEGVLRGLTTPEYVTEENVQMLIDRKIPDWPINRYKQDFDFKQPYLQLDEDRFVRPKQVYYSTLTTQLANVAPRQKTVIDTALKAIKFSVINSDIINLYRLAFENDMSLATSINRVYLDVLDSTRFLNTGRKYSDQWQSANHYCYEAVLPLGTSIQQQREVMLQDLNRYLGSLGKIEKRNMDCYVIVKIDNLQPGKETLNIPSSQVIHFKNIGELVKSLNAQKGSFPVIDESNANNLTLQIKTSDLSNIQNLRTALRLRGLDIIPAKRWIDMIVLRDKY